MSPLKHHGPIPGEKKKSTLRKLRHLFRPQFEEVPTKLLRRDWDRKSPEDRMDAILGLESQLSNRGGSHKGVQVFIAFMAGVEVALATLNIDKGMLSMRSHAMAWAAMLDILGLILLVIAALPFMKEVLLGRTRHPGREALRGKFQRFYELTRRNIHQRRVLHRTRLWLMIAALPTIASAVLTIVGLAHYLTKM